MPDTYVCPDCGAPARGASTCAECGHDLDAESQLPTAEEYEAGGVEAAEEARRSEAEEIEQAAWREQDAPPFKSPRVRGQVLQLWLVGGIFVDVALGVLSAIHAGVLDDVESGEPGALSRLASSDDRLAIASVAALVVFLVTAVFFVAWFHRSYKNLPALGCPDRRHRVGWTIGAWFIPIVAWIIPKRITDDIWRCSVPSGEFHWQLRRVPNWVHLWWFLFILGNLLGNASYRIYDGGETIDAERTSAIVDVVAAPVYVVGAILTWLIVDRISKAQDANAPPPRAAAT